MCDACGPFGSATVLPSRRSKRTRIASRGWGCAGRRSRARPRCRAAAPRAPSAARAARAGRTARTSRTPTPGCPAARTRACRRRCRTRWACRAAATRPRTPRVTPSAASAGLTWSWGPTDTPPETITTSACSSACAERLLGGGAVVAQALGAAGVWPRSRCRARRASGRWSCGSPRGPSGSPGARSSSPVLSTWTVGRRETDSSPEAGGDGGAELGGAAGPLRRTAPWCRRACPRRRCGRSRPAPRPR